MPWIFTRNVPDDWLIVSPRAIEFEPETAEHETGYSWIEMPEAGWPEFDAFDGAVQALADFVIALPDVYNSDSENTLILGFSQGAATALVTAIEHPNICKGIAALVGFVPDLPINKVEAIRESQPLANLPILMAVGNRDERIPLEISQRSLKTLQLAGANPEWNLYQTGHKLNGQGMRDLTAWLEKFI